MTDAVGEKVNDFYEKLVWLIDGGELQQALNLFGTIEGEHEQLRTLYQITNDLSLILARARDLNLAHALALALAHALALVLVLDDARDIDIDIDEKRANDIDIIFTRSMALSASVDPVMDSVLTRARTRAVAYPHDIDRDLSRARSRALELACVRARDIDLVFTHAYIGFIISTPIMKLKVNDVSSQRLITLDGISTFTPQLLSIQVSPYLEALTEIQTVISDLKNEPVPTFEISTISKINPVLISLLGVPEAINTVLDLVIPWRREHEKEMKRLEREEKGANIVDTWTDTAEKQINNKYKDAELQIQNERLRLENEMLREELKEKRNRRLQSDLELMEVAMSIVQKYAPDLPKPQQLEYAKKLLAPTSTIVTSQLELRDGRDEQT